MPYCHAHASLWSLSSPLKSGTHIHCIHDERLGVVLIDGSSARRVGHFLPGLRPGLLGAPARRDQTRLVGEDDGLNAIAQVQLRQDAADVALDSGRAQEQP